MSSRLPVILMHFLCFTFSNCRIVDLFVSRLYIFPSRFSLWHSFYSFQYNSSFIQLFLPLYIFQWYNSQQTHDAVRKFFFVYFLKFGYVPPGAPANFQFKKCWLPKPVKEAVARGKKHKKVKTGNAFVCYSACCNCRDAVTLLAFGHSLFFLGFCFWW